MGYSSTVGSLCANNNLGYGEQDLLSPNYYKYMTNMIHSYDDGCRNE